jgi:hypothetical protein
MTLGGTGPVGAVGLAIKHYLAIGPDASVYGGAAANSLLYVRDDANDAPTTSPVGGTYNLTYTGAGLGVIAFGSIIDVAYAGVSPGSGTAAYGLSFTAWHKSGQPLGGVYGIRGYVKSSAAGTGALTIAKACVLQGLWSGVKPATAYGLQILLSVLGPSGVTLAYGVKVDDSLATTAYLAEIGPSSPYFRIIGGANPAANQTNLYVKEQATLRQVQWVAADAGGHIPAGSRVMILV